MKRPLTIRIEPNLLEAARHGARQENRTLANFVATFLRGAVGEVATGGLPAGPELEKRAKHDVTDAK